MFEPREFDTRTLTFRNNSSGSTLNPDTPEINTDEYFPHAREETSIVGKMTTFASATATGIKGVSHKVFNGLCTSFNFSKKALSSSYKVIKQKTSLPEKISQFTEKNRKELLFLATSAIACSLNSEEFLHATSITLTTSALLSLIKKIEMAFSSEVALIIQTTLLTTSLLSFPCDMISRILFSTELKFIATLNSLFSGGLTGIQIVSYIRNATKPKAMSESTDIHERDSKPGYLETSQDPLILTEDEIDFIREQRPPAYNPEKPALENSLYPDLPPSYAKAVGA